MGSPLRFYLIFRKDNQGSYTTKALLYQDILSISIDREKEENLKYSQPITHWDLSKRLMKRNHEFRDRYKDLSTRNYKISSRIEYTRRRIKGKLEDLIYLRLMKKGKPVKETKGTGIIDTFTYTEAGNLVAWLIEDPKQLPYATSRIYDLLIDGFELREDSSSITILKFLKNCKDRKIFDKLVEYFSYLIHLEDSNIRSLNDLLTLIFESGFSGAEVQTELLSIWYETIQDLEPDIRKLMLYRTKISLERRFEHNRISVSKRSEEFRFKLRSDYKRIAIQGYCESCKSMQNVALPYLELTKLSLTSNTDIRVNCPVCNAIGSLLISNV